MNSRIVVCGVSAGVVICAAALVVGTGPVLAGLIGQAVALMVFVAMLMRANGDL